MHKLNICFIKFYKPRELLKPLIMLKSRRHFKSMSINEDVIIVNEVCYEKLLTLYPPPVVFYLDANCLPARSIQRKLNPSLMNNTTGP